jgi:hypothetical protein
MHISSSILPCSRLHTQTKLLGIISVDSNVINQLMNKYSEFVRFWEKGGAE